MSFLHKLFGKSTEPVSTNTPDKGEPAPQDMRDAADDIALPDEPMPSNQTSVDVVAQLQQHPPSNAICYFVMKGELPFTGAFNDDECALCFTRKGDAEELLPRLQGRIASYETTSLLAIGRLTDLWLVLNIKARSGSYPPYGLIIDLTYEGERDYSSEDIMQLGAEGFKRDFNTLPSPARIPPLKISLENEHKQLTIAQVVDALLAVYRSHSSGTLPTSASQQVRAIGTALHRTGGMKLMITIHTRFSEQNRMLARSLEREWDGIGDWRG